MDSLFSIIGFGVVALLMVTYLFTRMCMFEKRISDIEEKVK